MKTDSLTLYSSIRPALMKKSLFKGTLIGALGLLPLFYSSIFLNSSILSAWGIPIFLVSLSVIAVGMLPFRRLTYLEMHPCKLVIEDKTHWIFYQEGKKVLTIPYQIIKKTFYYEKNSIYGIAISLKENSEKKVIVHKKTFLSSSIQKRNLKRFQSDLFLPYFSYKSYKRIFNEN